MSIEAKFTKRKWFIIPRTITLRWEDTDLRSYKDFVIATHNFAKQYLNDEGKHWAENLKKAKEIEQASTHSAITTAEDWKEKATKINDIFLEIQKQRKASDGMLFQKSGGRGKSFLYYLEKTGSRAFELVDKLALSAELVERDKAIANKNKTIAEKDQTIAKEKESMQLALIQLGSNSQQSHEVTGLLTTIVKLQQKLEEDNITIKTLENNLHSLRNELESKKLESAQQHNSIQEHQEKIKRLAVLERQLQETNEKYNESLELSQQYHATILEKNIQVETLTSKKEQLEISLKTLEELKLTTLASMEEERFDLNSRNNKLLVEIKALETKTQDLESENKLLKEEIDNEKKLSQKQVDEIKNKDERIAEQEEMIQKKGKENESLKAELVQTKNKITTLLAWFNKILSLNKIVLTKEEGDERDKISSLQQATTQSPGFFSRFGWKKNTPLPKGEKPDETMAADNEEEKQDDASDLAHTVQPQK